MLADSGFTHVININGAMTEFNLLKNQANPCLSNLYETANAFQLVSPKEVARMINTEKNLFILDVRTDSAFRGIARDAAVNAQGRLKGAINIPLALLAASLDRVPVNRPVLVIADFGRETNLAARLLAEHGYTRVKAAFNGMNEWMNATKKELPQRDTYWQHQNRFGVLAAEEMNEMLTQSPNTYLLDVRTREEFTNQVSKRPWMNRGHILNAVNIPADELSSRLGELSDLKNKTIILYTFGSNAEVFESARLLGDQGFTKVLVLTGGIWSVRAKAANLKGLSRLMKWVVDIPADNL